MAFAARYKFAKVMLGVLVATVLNHALAVAVGSLLSRVPGLEVWIRGVAALSFIFFGLWTLRGDKLEGEQDRRSRFGAVVTVGVAFFLAEMGDKTQLATVALAAQYPSSPVGVLIGTTAGMLAADAFGIVVSVLLCRRIPERIVKLASAGLFILFGFLSVWQVMEDKLKFPLPLRIGVTAGLFSIVAVAAAFLVRRFVKAGAQPPPPDLCKIRDE
jgi:putative Ca2+/H+ antiporter (TMEM165/GDT1 family)